MIAPWPKRRPELEDPDSEAQMALLMDVIRSIRNLRGELGLPPGKPARCVVVAGDAPPGCSWSAIPLMLPCWLSPSPWSSPARSSLNRNRL